MNEDKAISMQRFFSLYLGTLSALFLVFLAVWQTAAILPHSKAIRDLFLAENSLVEALALSFLIAALALATLALWRARKSGAFSPYWWLFPLAIFLLICDETSFGRVYYDWYSPLSICGAKFDALHDALAVIPHCLPQLGISKTVFVAGAGLVLLLALVAIGAFAFRKKAAIILSLQKNPVWLYLSFAFILFWLGGGLEFIIEIDSLGIEKKGFLVFLEEALESFAEYTVLFAAIAFLKFPRA
jgi:hypothetical protein